MSRGRLVVVEDDRSSRDAMCRLLERYEYEVVGVEDGGGVLDLIAREGYRLADRSFTLDEAKTAREAFLTSTTSDVLPVVRIDDAPVANGYPGELSRKLRSAYFAHAAGAA